MCKRAEPTAVLRTAAPAPTRPPAVPPPLRRIASGARPTATWIPPAVARCAATSPAPEAAGSPLENVVAGADKAVRPVCGIELVGAELEAGRVLAKTGQQRECSDRRPAQLFRGIHADQLHLIGA